MMLGNAQLQEFFSKVYGFECRQGVEWLQPVRDESGEGGEYLPALRSEYVSCLTSREAIPQFTARLMPPQSSSLEGYGHAEDLRCAPLGEDRFSCISDRHDFQFVIQRGEDAAYSIPFGHYVSFLETWSPRAKAMHDLIRQQFSGVFWAPASW